MKTTSPRIIACLLCLLLNACVYDQRKTLAHDLLFDHQGRVIKYAFDAVVAAHFPPGSSIRQLQQFTEQHDGKCHSHHETTQCIIPLVGGICGVRLIEITATSQQGVIQTTRFSALGAGC